MSRPARDPSYWRSSEALELIKTRFEKYTIPVTETGCILWTGAAINKDGYGNFYFCPGRKMSAHRAAWFLAGRELTPGMFVCHKCDTPPCVNVTHLFLGTVRDNVLDMERKGRKVQFSGFALPHTKLSADQVRSILTDTRRQIEIAADYGITQSMVSKIKLRQKRYLVQIPEAA